MTADGERCRAPRAIRIRPGLCFRPSAADRAPPEAAFASCAAPSRRGAAGDWRRRVPSTLNRPPGRSKACWRRASTHPRYDTAATPAWTTYLPAVASDGHYRYSASSNQTPIWVTGQVLVAAELKPFPLAAVPRAAGSNGGGSSGAGSNGSRSGSGSGGGGAGAGKGATHPSLSRHSREGRGQSSADGSARSGAKRSGGAPPPQSTAPGHPQNASVTTNTTDATEGNGGGTSPLVPIAIALGAGGLVIGGTWWAARRFS